MSDSAPTLVVFGLDPDGNPRTGCFAETDAKAAIKAAGLLGYQVVRVSDDEILKTVPSGNVCGRGSRFIRRINRVAFEKLSIACRDGAKEEGRDER